MNDEIKVSVIVPIHNTEQYLKRCLESLINQSLQEIEIILIDDGSTDNSLKLIKSYAEKDNRIKILTQANSGAASARNAGLFIAKGEYVGFVDSDDYIDLSFYEKLYKKAKETNSEIVKCKGRMIELSGKTSSFGVRLEMVKKNKAYLARSFTTCIYDRNFMRKNKIIFPTDMCVGEDAFLILNAVLKTDKIEFIDEELYYYIRRENSLDSKELNDEKIKSILKFISNSIELICNSDLDSETFNIIYTEKINHLLQDTFHKTQSLEMRSLIVRSVMNFWRKCKFKELYAKENPIYVKYFEKQNACGLMFLLLRMSKGTQEDYLLNLFGVIPLMNVIFKGRKTVFKLWNFLPLMIISQKSRKISYRFLGFIPVLIYKDNLQNSSKIQIEENK